MQNDKAQPANMSDAKLICIEGCWSGCITRSDDGYFGCITRSDDGYFGCITRSDDGYFGCITR
jgi:hypothetical protein